MSTLQCVKGSIDGPLEKSYPCPSWVFTTEDCPEVPNCSGYLDCGSCAQKDDCAWCASENTCVTLSEAYSKDCRGLVFDLPCPDTYVSGIFFLIYFFSSSSLLFFCFNYFNSFFLFFFLNKRKCGNWKSCCTC